MNSIREINPEIPGDLGILRGWRKNKMGVVGEFVAILGNLSQNSL